MKIDDFIKKLSTYEGSDTVFNMYWGDSGSAVECRERLREYLTKNQKAQILLVGEAPGYKGCARTGVPFTSDSNEASAKAVREFFEKNCKNAEVLMWNAFPFHPHEKNNRDSNRKPNASELNEGLVFLKEFLETFPNLICFGAIGRVAERSLNELEPERKPSYIRHPAHGGKRQFMEDMNLAMSRFCTIIDWEDLLKHVASTVKGDKAAAYHYLKEHEEEFRDWYYSGDHDKYPHGFWRTKTVNF